ncbi:MASE1 domain-containing protein [Sphingomonas sp.]|uniref:sensor histidine kinase n=1 Tax=Sphingomonas sp. TaxID=28214 RepID=UPI00307D7946
MSAAAPVKQASPQSRESSAGIIYLVWLAGVAIAYIAGAQLGFALAFATKQVTAVWPPTGIALAAFLLRGNRIWPAVFAGAFISNAISQEPILTAGGIALGNTLGPLLGAILLRRIVKIEIGLGRVRDVLGLALLGSALAMMVTATNGVVNLVLGGIVPLPASPSVWWVWWVGDTMGALLVAPAILTCFHEPKGDLNGARLLELGTATVALALVSLASFSSELPLAYPVFPIVIWVGLRFGQRETALAILGVSAIAVWQTIHGAGPFVAGSLDQRLGLLVTFLAVLSITGLMLGALAAERRRAEASLRLANEELEARVVERTAELEQANRELASTNVQLGARTEELARKNEEVEAFVYIVSHDLRAPLVNLQGFSRELELSCKELETTLAEAQVAPNVSKTLHTVVEDGIGGALRYIGSSVSKFERLINALLLLSRTGQQEYRIETIDTVALVTSTVDTYRQTIEAAGATVIVGDLPEAQGDMTAIGQVFSNLLGNSLKYLRPGRPGKIEIGGVLEETGLRYWVRDNGAGIPESVRPRLFQIFQRFHPELASGDGIGLAAIKRIVERHGGRIWVDSICERGSTFQFTLPITTAE